MILKYMEYEPDNSKLKAYCVSLSQCLIEVDESLPTPHQFAEHVNSTSSDNF